MTHDDYGFTHQRLHAYRAARRLFVGVERLAAGFPRGHADLRDQLRRAAKATVLNTAEGANRFHHADKAARFLVARGEVGECDAAMDLAQAIGLGDPNEFAQLRQLAGRVGAMLTALIKREQRLAQ